MVFYNWRIDKPDKVKDMEKYDNIIIKKPVQKAHRLSEMDAKTF